MNLGTLRGASSDALHIQKKSLFENPLSEELTKSELEERPKRFSRGEWVELHD